MGRMLDAGISFFQGDEWPYEQQEGKLLLRTGFSGDNGNFTCWFQAREDEEQLVFYSICPVHAPEDKRMLIAEFIARANYGMVIGNFEIDLNDGEIRYKSSADVEGIEVQPVFVKNMVYANVLMMDRYLPGIMKVIYSSIDPAKAVAEVER